MTESDSLLYPAPFEKLSSYVGSNTRGKIVVADDKYMNIAALKDYLVQLNYIDRVEFRTNG
jgi:PleD family two-component response regulator